MATAVKERTIPPLSPPGDDVCHIRANEGQACCGYKGTRRCVSQEPVPAGASSCPHCGRPRCPTCKQIASTFRNGGGWEGP